MRNKLSIYKASAGSGKTHALTQEFLKLAFGSESSSQFKHILAVTFTNKAADEMKERIVKELGILSQNPQKSANLDILLQSLPSATAASISKRAQDILIQILHNYSQFAVGTIDSFVQRAVSSFSYEIGIHSGYKVELDYEKVVGDITHLLYGKINTDAELLQWLINFANHKIDEGKHWDFNAEITNLTYEIFKETYQQNRINSSTFFDENQNPDSNIPKKEELINFSRKLVSEKYEFINALKSIGLQATRYINKPAIEIDSLGRNFKTITNYLTKKICSPKNNDDYIPNDTILNALEGVENWVAKSAKKDVLAQVQQMHSYLSDCLRRAVSIYENEFSHYLTVCNILSNFHAFGILTDVAALLPQYRDDNNVLLITDTTLLLKQIIAQNDTPFVYEKIGNRYNNLLIDEFQDTSNFQWQNFKPLIINSLSNNNFNLIVGDVKQSIYRWRNGDWRLLLQKVEQDVGNEYIKNITLETNWRSQSNIVYFNNLLFQEAPKIASKYLVDEDDMESDSANIIEKAYSDSYQQVPVGEKKIGGKVSIQFVECKRIGMAAKWREGIEEKIPQCIENLLLTGYSPADIAILVRRNVEGKHIVDLLMDFQLQNTDCQKYNIISADSLFIRNSAVVRILIASLKLIINQADELHRLALEFLLKEKNSKPELLSELVSKALIFRKMSLYDLVENVISHFQLNQMVSEQPYLRSFQDVVLNFVRNEFADLEAFLDWWEEHSPELSLQLSSQQNAVQVLTIHKSKGLAFPVVIIPYCDWRLDHSAVNSPILWCNTQGTEYEQFPALPIKYKHELRKTIFKKEYEDEKLYTCMDALNMLYVAFTRPRQELIVFCPTDKTDKVSYISDILYNALSSPLCKTEIIEKHSASFGDSDLLFQLATNHDVSKHLPFTKETTSNFEIAKYENNAWSEKLKIKHDSTNYFIASDEHRKEKINYGTLMHEIMSKIQTIDDIYLVMKQMLFMGRISKSEMEPLKTKVEKFISFDKVKHWFTNDWQVISEAEILTAKGEKKIPDRIMASAEKTIVIDFKFGAPHESHKQQVSEYADLLQNMDFKNIEAYLYYPEKKSVIQVN